LGGTPPSTPPSKTSFPFFKLINLAKIYKIEKPSFEAKKHKRLSLNTLTLFLPRSTLSTNLHLLSHNQELMFHVLPSLILAYFTFTFSQFPDPVYSRVRTREVSKRVPVTHDTYLYLCSLNEQQSNEQNIVVKAFAALKSKAGTSFPITGHVGPTGFGRDQNSVLISSKGCSYKSDFNAGYSAGPNTEYKQGVEMHYYVTTTNNEVLYLRIFRTLPVWNITASLGHPLYDRGQTSYFVSEALWKNSPNPDTDQVTWIGQNLLQEPCTSPTSIKGCSYKNLGEMRQNDRDCTNCKFSLVYPQWQDYMPAYYPG
jgi:hypothetical protein